MKRRAFINNIPPALAAPFLFNGTRLRARLRGDRLADAVALLGDTDRVLVIVQLEGGNDGLNTIIPVDDDIYYRLRPKLGVAKGDSIPLAGQPLVRMHPTMSGMASMFDSGLLAVVGGLGYDRMTLSHFAGTEIWNTASGGRGVQLQETGWAGRYLMGEFPSFPDVLPQDPPAIEISPSTSSIFTTVGASIGMSLVDPQEFYQLVNAGTSIDDNVDIDSLAGREWSFIDAIDRQSRTFADSVRDAYVRSSNTVLYPDNNFARSMSIVARLIAGGLRTRIYKVTLGNFDTHGYQATVHPQLLATLSDGVKAFQDDLSALGVAGRVVGMTYSEFGRRAQENGQGTDHGTAAPHFVFGSTVDGGKYFGGLPELARLDEFGNLPVSTSFHCYYASVLAPLFVIDEARLAQILPVERCDSQYRIPLFRASGVASRNDVASSTQLRIYPNPASGIVRLRITGNLPDAELPCTIVDAGGRVVLDRQVRVTNGHVAIDVSSLPEGSFVVTVAGVPGRLVISR